MNSGGRRPGFTLIEMLVVVGVIALAMGMVAFLPTGDKRDAAVSSAAQELAATMRLARSMAMDRKCTVAVAFNVQNGEGTSGKLLNNHSGGHWYRIIGPDENTIAGGGFATYPKPGYYSNNTIGSYLAVIAACWVGDRHVLPTHRVRFIALSDQDDGSLVDSAAGDAWANFLPGYPRPWFGHWDAANKRLQPWGGYDPAILSPVEATPRQSSGFYYAGRDGTITGCTNPADRDAADGSARIFAQGAGRPLINAQWLDYCIEFNPDGTVSEAQPFPERIWSFRNQATPPNGDIGDLSGWPTGGNLWAFGKPPKPVDPMVSYAPLSGWWAITLGPDTDSDSDRFDNAQSAVTSLMPAYRVMINRLGVVKVARVSRTAPAGTAFDTTTIPNWQDRTKTKVYYWQNLPTKTDRTWRCTPAAEFLTSDMMANNTWWLAVAP